MVFVPLGMASLWRIPTAIRRPESRILWTVFTSLALAMATRITPIGCFLYDITGVISIDTLAKHLLGILSVAMLLRWVLVVAPGVEDGVPDPRFRRAISNRSRKAVTWATIVVITVVFPFSNFRKGDYEDSDFIYNQAGHVWGTLHLLLFYAYLIFGMSCAAMVCADTGRRARGHMLGRGLQLMAVGLAIGCGYGLLRSFYLIIRLCHRRFLGGDPLLNVGSNACLMVCLVLVIMGSSSTIIDRVNANVAQHAAINDLRPMWAQLTKYAPGVVLDATASTISDSSVGGLRMPANPKFHFRMVLIKRRTRSFLARAVRPAVQLAQTVPVPRWMRRRWRHCQVIFMENFDWRNLEWRLLRRVVEIHDAAMTLQAYVPAGLQEETKEAASKLGLSHASVPAYLLHVAIRRKRSHQAPSDMQAREPIICGHDSTELSARILLEIGRQMSHRPTMAALDLRLSRLTL
jgi:hypothetical protein